MVSDTNNASLRLRDTFHFYIPEGVCVFNSVELGQLNHAKNILLSSLIFFLQTLK